MFIFVFNSMLLGVGLAMDAFSVSLANGLKEPSMRKRKMCLIAGTFAFFQALMPMIGWTCVHTIVETFKSFEKFIPWIALVLLGVIGTKMIVDGIKSDYKDDDSTNKTGFLLLLAQGVATSIDALSVGFAIADDPLRRALLSALIIATVTFMICIGGLLIGRKFGTKLSDKASIFGGVILVVIGLEIFITNL
ncbi:MAG: manganese efflux pump [Ruminococcus sp.]|nr:manganese efflux pump [Ruminococcus sp.]